MYRKGNLQKFQMSKSLLGVVKIVAHGRKIFLTLSSIFLFCLVAIKTFGYIAHSK